MANERTDFTALRRFVRDFISGGDNPARDRTGAHLDLYPSRIYYASVTDISGGRVKNRLDAPLTPAVLHILLALSTEERHGYGIMKQVERESGGKVKMGPGTLYGSIGRMMAAGLIREADKRVDPAMDDERRIYYALTALGRRALAAELDRYREVVAVATEKGVARSAIAHG